MFNRLRSRTPAAIAPDHKEWSFQPRSFGEPNRICESMTDSAPATTKARSSDTVRAITNSGSRNGGLPDRLKRRLEALSGIDCSDIKVNMDSQIPSQFGAAGLTRGREIHLGPGQEKFLAHEAWHTIQQKQGRVKFEFAANPSINRDADLEREAELMGTRAESGTIPVHFGIARPTPPMTAPIQLAKTGNAGWGPLKSIKTTSHYRDQIHIDAKNCREQSDTDRTISNKIYGKHRGKKHQDKLVTFIPAGGKGTLVIVTYADDEVLIYDTAYFSKGPKAPDESSAMAFQPVFEGGFTLTY